MVLVMRRDISVVLVLFLYFLALVARLSPGIKMISHHHGAMVPFFTARFDTQRRNFKEGEQGRTFSPYASYSSCTM